MEASNSSADRSPKYGALLNVKQATEAKKTVDDISLADQMKIEHSDN